MIESAYGIVGMLPADRAEAMAVLTIVKDIVEQATASYCGRKGRRGLDGLDGLGNGGAAPALRRRPNLVSGLSGASRKRRPASAVTKSKPPR